MNTPQKTSLKLEIEQTRQRPLFRWAGSKRQIIHRLLPYWNDEFQRYVEPFAGSAALFFAVNPPKALLGDLNQDLIEAYMILRDSPRALYRRVTSIPRNRKTYQLIRNKKPSSLTRFQRATRFVYLNRFCFNGIYRTNLQGEFNVPYSPSGTGTFPPLKEFERCAEILGRADIHSWEFSKTLGQVKKGDFVYIDPPYAVQERRVFREYGPKLFGNDDLQTLKDLLVDINRKGAVFLLSYADSKEARDTFSNWKMKRMRVRRNISGFSSGRRFSYEVMASNAF